MVLKNVTLLGIAVSAVSATNAPLTMLNDPKAKCLDGTQAGYYAQSASKPEDKNKWVIYLNGGGECDTESACVYQTSGSLGSSKYFSNVSESSGWFLGSDYCPYNPSFCGWNHAFDPYCTQDLHAGQVTKPSESNWGLYFAGHHVFVATLDDLDKRSPNSLLDATDIIIQGVSAGGIGVWMNIDYVAKRYPKAHVTAVTIAGHYFYATYYTGTNHTNPGGMADFREAAFPGTYDLYEAYVDETCKIAYEAKGQHPGACMLSNNSFPYIQSDSFVIQSQTDQVVLTGHDCWPETYMHETEELAYMNEWHANMSVALQPLLATSTSTSSNTAEDTFGRKPKNGVFAAACYTHTGFTHSAPLINGLSYSQAFALFYFNSSTVTPESYKLTDNCGVMCNPTCA